MHASSGCISYCLCLDSIESIFLIDSDWLRIVVTRRKRRQRREEIKKLTTVKIETLARRVKADDNDRTS